mmetsp:Transcript_22671/g.63729  ORF Transcript_22671/g.63729 Transcript_22671/m.63729 type:complete len:359 (+) Transcript_22671:840-1916(+)
MEDAAAQMLAPPARAGLEPPARLEETSSERNVAAQIGPELPVELGVRHLPQLRHEGPWEGNRLDSDLQGLVRRLPKDNGVPPAASRPVQRQFLHDGLLERHDGLGYTDVLCGEYLPEIPETPLQVQFPGGGNHRLTTILGPNVHRRIRHVQQVQGLGQLLGSCRGGSLDGDAHDWRNGTHRKQRRACQIIRERGALAYRCPQTLDTTHVSGTDPVHLLQHPPHEHVQACHRCALVPEPRRRRVGLRPAVRGRHAGGGRRLRGGTHNVDGLTAAQSPGEHPGERHETEAVAGRPAVGVAVGGGAPEPARVVPPLRCARPGHHDRSSARSATLATALLALEHHHLGHVHDERSVRVTGQG